MPYQKGGFIVVYIGFRIATKTILNRSDKIHSILFELNDGFNGKFILACISYNSQGFRFVQNKD